MSTKLLGVRFGFCLIRRVIITLLIAFSVFEFDDSTVMAQSPQQIAQWKSQRMAQLGTGRLVTRRRSPYSTAPMGLRHVRPGLQPRNGAIEGVGYSPNSPQQAIRNACHYGQRPIVASSVARGRDGYFATVYYR